jgi:saccharopine dehydrogenase-like NADP-dependent oxidoreductase
MRRLHLEAAKAGVCLMNEVGLDPGIDHMSAMSIIDQVRPCLSQLSAYSPFVHYKLVLYFCLDCHLPRFLFFLFYFALLAQVRDMGGRVLSFESMCGGLPAPEAADNPLGYKFSWSPRGVLLAAQNAAKFFRDGKVCFIHVLHFTPFGIGF